MVEFPEHLEANTGKERCHALHQATEENGDGSGTCSWIRRDCCAKDGDQKAIVADLWDAFCNFAPWAPDYRGVFGAILHEAMAAVFTCLARDDGDGVARLLLIQAD